jgi:OOP family OmpA-OmpF porin
MNSPLPALFLILAASTASAQVLDLPANARMSAEDRDVAGVLALATGSWANGSVPARRIEGALSRQAWRIPETSLTPFQILAPLRDALTDAGYEILLECADQACGGFDFRYSLDLLPEPDMHVDLGNFQYLAAEGPDETGIVLVASRTAATGYLHLARVGKGPAPVISGPVAEPDEAPRPDVALPLVGRLLQEGHASLDDLEFATGSSELAPTVFSSLIALATWLNADPERRVILVGHSDNEGDLDRNITLSESRATSVVTRLIEAHGVAPGQLRSRGVGFLAPRASNATPEGRALNRRVEAVLAEG